MNKFAKLFESPRHGQILIILHKNEEGNPALSVSFIIPSEGLAHIAMNYPATEDGQEEAEGMFDVADIELLEELVDTTILNGGELELH